MIRRLLVGATLCAIAAPAAAQPSFTGVGQHPLGTNNTARGVSADGSFAVGHNTGPGLPTQGYRWTAAGGMQDLGFLVGSVSEIYAIAADGGTAVGLGSRAAGPPPVLDTAIRWTEAEGIVSLGDLPGGITSSRANAISDDGSVIVGFGQSELGLEAFRWTAAEGMQGLGDLPGGSFRSNAWAISADGTTIVGGSTSIDLGGFEFGEAFRWTADGGMVGLGALPGGGLPGGGAGSFATAASADGSVVVGRAVGASGRFEAFRWTADAGMVSLGDPPGGAIETLATDVSGDGAIVVGRSRLGTEPRAVIWDAAAGMRPLDEALIGLGLDLTGWTLFGAEAISTDGSTIVGSGRNPDGVAEGWVAVIPVPEPAKGALWASGLLALAALRRRRITPRSSADR